jgi:hypothetical protein
LELEILLHLQKQIIDIINLFTVKDYNLKYINIDYIKRSEEKRNKKVEIKEPYKYRSYGFIHFRNFTLEI